MLCSRLERRSFQNCFPPRTNGTSALAAEAVPPEPTEESPTVPSAPTPSLSAVTAAEEDTPPLKVVAVNDTESSPAETGDDAKPLTVTADTAPARQEEEPLAAAPANDDAVYYPVGTEYVKSDSDLPKADNQHTLPDAAGIVYEVAEELYCREKTAAEIEALCQPPFRKVFDAQQMERLDRQAAEATRRLLSEWTDGTETAPVASANTDDQQPVSFAQAFGLQTLLMIPVVNVAAALLLGFRKCGNANVKACCRAFLLWLVLLMTVALGFLAVGYFTEPAHAAFFSQLLALFSA